MKSSGIGGEAVLEGIMMRNGDDYAVAVRKPDGEIDVTTDTYHSVCPWPALTKIPILRGVVNFLDSLILGTKALFYSASFYDDEEDEKESLTSQDAAKKERQERMMMVGVVALSIVMVVLIFIVLPYGLSALLRPVISSYVLRTLIEGVFRIAIFLLYIWLIARMEDIKRTFMDHGAEHKCINCVEHGLPLTVENVRISSRQHRRCGTSFLFFVVLVSIVLFLLIPIENPVLRVVVRILLVPVIAGIAYEILRLAGRSNNIFIRALSAPGLAIQRMVTAEPTDDMIEVAIQAVDAVFDWRKYEAENFEDAA